MRGPRPKHRSVYRREADHWLIELRLRELRQLFHHLDPAPFREKDLDPAAEAYNEDAVREIGVRQPLRLVIHLQTHVELVRLLRRAVVNLAIGLLFHFACLSLRRSLQVAGSYEVLAEGLLIIGWVALWRPVEMFLYDWWPIRRRQRRLEATARMPVDVR